MINRHIKQQQCQSSGCRYLSHCISRWGSDCRHRGGDRIPQMRKEEGAGYRRFQGQDRALQRAPQSLGMVADMILGRYDMRDEKIISVSELRAGKWVY